MLNIVNEKTKMLEFTLSHSTSLLKYQLRSAQHCNGQLHRCIIAGKHEVKLPQPFMYISFLHILNGWFTELDRSVFAFLKCAFLVAISWKGLGPPKLPLELLTFFLLPDLILHPCKSWKGHTENQHTYRRKGIKV